MQLIAILAVLVAANFGVVYYGSDALEDQNINEAKGIVEVQEETDAPEIDSTNPNMIKESTNSTQ